MESKHEWHQAPTVRCSIDPWVLYLLHQILCSEGCRLSAGNSRLRRHLKSNCQLDFVHASQPTSLFWGHLSSRKRELASSLIRYRTKSLQEKHDWFYGEMRKIRMIEQKVSVYVDRDRIFETTLNQLGSRDKSDWRKTFQIHYKDSPGLDAGGLTRAWFHDVLQYAFSSEAGLVRPCPSFPSDLNALIRYFTWVFLVIAVLLRGDGQYHLHH